MTNMLPNKWYDADEEDTEFEKALFTPDEDDTDVDDDELE